MLIDAASLQGALSPARFASSFDWIDKFSLL
jgi:hypothetical protein